MIRNEDRGNRWEKIDDDNILPKMNRLKEDKINTNMWLKTTNNN